MTWGIAQAAIKDSMACAHTSLLSLLTWRECAKGNDCLPPETGDQALASLFRPVRFYVCCIWNVSADS